jgi:hypothetical protein
VLAPLANLVVMLNLVNSNDFLDSATWDADSHTWKGFRTEFHSGNRVATGAPHYGLRRKDAAFSFLSQDLAAMHSLELGKWIAALALFFTVGCSYPHVYCAPDNCGDCNPNLNAPACADCGGPDCQVPCGKPARGLFTHLGYLASCGGGCGEFYIHPWINERPAKCDPCNNHGDWTGPGDCCNRGFWKSFWGDKGCSSGCGSCTTSPACGCDTCGGGPMSSYPGTTAYPGTMIEGEVYEGEVYDQPVPSRPPAGGQMQPQPTPAPPAQLGPAARLHGTPTPARGTGVRHR